MRLARLALTLAIAATPALAEGTPVLAEYHSNSGSLPPEYAWQTDVTIQSDGALFLKHCREYQTEGPACKTRSAKVAPGALAGITNAATDSGLMDKPASPAEMPIVGGSVTWGAVYLGDAKVDLLSDPAKADIPRIAPVLNAVRTAIPQHLTRYLED